jgi:hypothetical protein
LQLAAQELWGESAQTYSSHPRDIPIIVEAMPHGWSQKSNPSVDHEWFRDIQTSAVFANESSILRMFVLLMTF